MIYFRTLNASITPQFIDFGDTFVGADHLRASFPQASLVFLDSASNPTASSTSNRPHYKLRFHSSIEVVSYFPEKESPYPASSELNLREFTPNQVEAIRSGLNKGLTLIVGPPGTGKSDTAVQIIFNLYRNHPNSKILLLTHSNAALNDLFHKIKERDINPRHLLRLGGGGQQLGDEEDRDGDEGLFTKQGRVNFSLQRRMELLAEVQRLAESLGGAQAGDVGASCETAGHFFTSHIAPRLDSFNEHSKDEAERKFSSVSEIRLAFPFKEFFNDVVDDLFDGTYLRIEHCCKFALFVLSLTNSIISSFSSDVITLMTLWHYSRGNFLHSCPLTETSPVASFVLTRFSFLVDSKDVGDALKSAKVCCRHVSKMFDELAELRAFELLRSQAHRADYLLTKQVDLLSSVRMTTTSFHCSAMTNCI